jgi:DNA-directed RNA polymerase subunit M/transcription elongation factor TFIIS
MKTIILTYLAIGIIANVWGPLAKRIKEEITDQDFASSLSTGKKSSASFYFIIRLLAILLYPFYYVIYIYFNYQREPSNGIVSQTVIVNETLYFSKMNGSGRVSCNDCGFTQRLVSLMYITKNGTDTTCRGYQCQSCGTFREMSYEGTLAVQGKSTKKMVYTDVAETCGCGGVLEREKILFCPQCQSQHLSYECIFRT